MIFINNDKILVHKYQVEIFNNKKMLIHKNKIFNNNNIVFSSVLINHFQD